MIVHDYKVGDVVRFTDKAREGIRGLLATVVTVTSSQWFTGITTEILDNTQYDLCQ